MGEAVVRRVPQLVVPDSSVVSGCGFIYVVMLS